MSAAAPVETPAYVEKQVSCDWKPPLESSYLRYFSVTFFAGLATMSSLFRKFALRKAATVLFLATTVLLTMLALLKGAFQPEDYQTSAKFFFMFNMSVCNQTQVSFQLVLTSASAD